MVEKVTQLTWMNLITVCNGNKLIVYESQNEYPYDVAWWGHSFVSREIVALKPNEVS